MESKHKKYNYRSIKLRTVEQELIEKLREQIKEKLNIVLNDNAVIRFALENTAVNK